ncbi:hypothetical protein M407DRAFT_242163 [Tulasnella calospora MUT 4182]|uniref:Uncharacterized protein n=1 Tax=Tulasnella calospora MUT 4182 TaxID=1051891 RepID=A0A0C3QRP6_9AGAM|nr:hypothetical protein M407DRAFT_242163 [Tulasnella calospora MUT 4182]
MFGNGNSRTRRSRQGGPLAGPATTSRSRGGLGRMFRRNRPTKTNDLKTFVDPHMPPKRRTEARRRLGLGTRSKRNAPIATTRKAPLSVRLRSMFHRNGTRTRSPGVGVGRSTRSRNPFARRAY